MNNKITAFFSSFSFPTTQAGKYTREPESERKKELERQEFQSTVQTVRWEGSGKGVPPPPYVIAAEMREGVPHTRVMQVLPMTDSHGTRAWPPAGVSGWGERGGWRLMQKYVPYVWPPAGALLTRLVQMSGATVARVSSAPSPLYCSLRGGKSTVCGVCS